MYKLCSTASGILGILAVALLVLGLSAVPALADDEGNVTCTYDEFGAASAGCWHCWFTVPNCNGFCWVGSCRANWENPPVGDPYVRSCSCIHF